MGGRAFYRAPPGTVGFHEHHFRKLCQGVNPLWLHSPDTLPGDQTIPRDHRARTITEFARSLRAKLTEVFGDRHGSYLLRFAHEHFRRRRNKYGGARLYKLPGNRNDRAGFTPRTNKSCDIPRFYTESRVQFQLSSSGWELPTLEQSS